MILLIKTARPNNLSFNLEIVVLR